MTPLPNIRFDEIKVDLFRIKQMAIKILGDSSQCQPNKTIVNDMIVHSQFVKLYRKW